MSRPLPLELVGVFTTLLFGVMAIHAAPLVPSIPAIQFSFSEASFRAVLAQWQPDGVARFTWHFAIDFPFLVSYGYFGFRLGQHESFHLKRSTLLKSLLSWTLPLAAVMDAAENLLHLALVHAAMAIPAALYFVAGVVATSKWVLIVAFVLAIVFAKVLKLGASRE